MLSYITPDSVHPPSLLKIHFFQTVCLLLRRLLDRGYILKTLEPLFHASITSIDTKETSVFNEERTIIITSSPRDMLFLHLTHHPKDIFRKRIRNIYDATCQPTLKFFHCDKINADIQDILYPNTLVEIPTCNMAKFENKRILV